MDSLDVAHVPPPDPRSYWNLATGQEVEIGERMFLKLLRTEVGSVRRAWVGFSLDNKTVYDWLNLDKPCVAIRKNSGAPWLTITLRALFINSNDQASASFQVTVDPKAEVVPRSSR